MTLRNEIMDAVATYKALAPTTQDRYYNQLMAENAEYENVGKRAIADARKRRRGATAPPTNLVPPPTTAAAPATGPAMAFNPGAPPDMPPVYKRGGKVKKFEDGGLIDEDPTNPGGEVSPNEADTIVRQLLGSEGTAAQRINRQVGEPDAAPGPGLDYAARGTADRIKTAADTAALQEREGQAISTAAPTVQPRSKVRRIADAVNNFVSPPGSEGQYRYDQKARQAIRDKTPGVTEPMSDTELAQRERDLGALYRQRADERNQALDLQAPRVDVTGFIPRTGDEQALIDEGLALPGQAKPQERAVTGGEPEVEPPQGAYPTSVTPPKAPSSVYGKVPGESVTGGEPEVAMPTGPYPRRTSAGAGGGARPSSPGTNGAGSGAGSTGPGSGNGNVPAPPPGASRTEDPRTRTAAFDPGRERIDPSGRTAARQLDQQGQVVYPSQQELASMVATAAQGKAGANGEAPPIGNGAVSRPVVREFVAAHNNGGELTDGQALMVGMHAKYKYLLSKGRAKEAAMMAWGLIQAANLEAASLGMVARDQINAGNLRAGYQTLAKAADWAPDGMKHVATLRGIDTYDANNQKTSSVQLDGKRALELALSLSDGTAMWQTLQSAASLVNPADKGAEGRQLTNDLRRLQIEAARRKLAGGGKGGGGLSNDAAILQRIIAGDAAPPPANSGGGGGNDDNWIFANTGGEENA